MSYVQLFQLSKSTIGPTLWRPTGSGLWNTSKKLLHRHGLEKSSHAGCPESMVSEINSFEFFDLSFRYQFWSFISLNCPHQSNFFNARRWKRKRSGPGSVVVLPQRARRDADLFFFIQFSALCLKAFWCAFSCSEHFSMLSCSNSEPITLEDSSRQMWCIVSWCMTKKPCVRMCNSQAF